MAHPQLENGYVRIAQELLAALTKIDLRGSEFMIALAVIGRTYGWNKKDDQISLSQFQSLTGMDRKSCARAIKRLVARMVLGSVKGDTSCVSTYWIQKDYEKWLTSGKIVPSGKTPTLPSGKTRSKLVAKPYINTTNTTKDNIQKTIAAPNPNVKILIDFFCINHEKTQQKKYAVAGGKDGKIFKDLLETFSVDELKIYIETYFSMKDDFIEQAGYSIGIFRSVIPKIQTGKAGRLAVMEREIYGQ